MMRIMARRMNAATVVAYRSKSRARRRLRLIQARVRSTIHGLGNTTDLCSSLRFTISRDPFAGGGSGRGSTRALIAAISENPLKERKQGARAGVERKRGAVAILNIGRVNCNAQQKTERIDRLRPVTFLPAS